MLSLNELRLKQTFVNITAEAWLNNLAGLRGTVLGSACKREVNHNLDISLEIAREIEQKEREEMLYNLALAESMRVGIDQRFCWVASRPVQ